MILRRGFTLVELLLVILIVGIVGAILVPVIVAPIEAYVDTTRRSDLAYTADAALRRIARDVHRALPYSLRVDAGGTAIEMLRVRDVARYRENGGAAARRLQFNGNDDQFNVIGAFPSITAPYAAGAEEHLVVFNLGIAGFDAYAGDPVIHSAGNFSISSESYSIGGTNYTEQKVTATNGSIFPFTSSSPSHRVFIIDGEVSYGCNGSGLYRLEDYGHASSMPSLATIASGELQSDQVTSCSFSYDPGSTNLPALLTLRLELTSEGESVRLLKQVYVPNET